MNAHAEVQVEHPVRIRGSVVHLDVHRRTSRSSLENREPHHDRLVVESGTLYICGDSLIRDPLGRLSRCDKRAHQEQKEGKLFHEVGLLTSKVTAYVLTLKAEEHEAK